MLRIATRASALARWQAERVGELLREPVEYVLITTTGDRDQRPDLHAIGGTGVFVKEVQQAVLDGRADLAVHSAKDLPVDDARTGSCSRRCPSAATRATRSWARRSKASRPAAGSAPVRCAGARSSRRPGPISCSRRLRGNIETRLRKQVDEGHDAVVVAVAALDRLGLRDQVTRGARSVDAAAAGRAGRARRSSAAPTTRARWRCSSRFDDAAAHLAVRAERAYLAELGGGCSLPCGALAPGRRGLRRDRARSAARRARRSHRAAHARRRNRSASRSVPRPRAICSTARAAAPCSTWSELDDRVPRRRGPG